MLKQLEGSQAIAEVIGLCRPKVVCAYPITPQTHIVEGIGELVRRGELQGCEFINVESEVAALSVAVGSSATGARSYTATSSQGLLYMMEVVYNVSGLRLPIVMTLGNRCIGAPINIWNDHSDAMAARDAGWVMLFAETNQEAADLHIQAFRIAEEFSIPVMVCVDGFILTHAYESVEIPDQKVVDDFLPTYECIHKLDINNPCAIGAMVPPNAFTEVRHMAHVQQDKVMEGISEISGKFKYAFGRDSGGLIRTYKIDNADAVIVCMGSIAGTIKDAIDELEEEGFGNIGCISVISYRPFPEEAIKGALRNTQKIIVLEKAFALGKGGILADEIRLAIKDYDKVKSVIAGLGGRPITKKQIKKMLINSQLEYLSFLELNENMV